MKVWIGNLGKYNEGELVGDWLELPVHKDELDKFLRERVGLQLTQKEVDEALARDGVCYEEYMINDWECELNCVEYHEYTHLDELNKLASFIKMANDIDKINAYCNYQNISDIDEVCNVIAQEDDIYISSPDYQANLSDEELVGYWYIDEVYDGIENYIKQCSYSEDDRVSLENYFDVESFGRDLRLNYSYDDSMPETAGEYWCSSENVTDEEIGQAYIDKYGFDSISTEELERYFDYGQYGTEVLYGEIAVIINEYGHQEILDYGDEIDVNYYNSDELYEMVEDDIGNNDAKELVNVGIDELNEGYEDMEL